jgi:NAD-reducing hydrogenase large subunit
MKAIEIFKVALHKYKEEVDNLANFPTLFMGLVNEEGNLEHYDGKIRVMNSGGTIVADGLEPSDYPKYIGEKVEDFSFLKSPYYLPFGSEHGAYRVGPLARINVANRCGTPLADKELEIFRSYGRVQNASFFYHYARLIEILYCTEMIEQLLSEESILSDHIRAFAGVNNLEAVGMSEAPRGMLLHHYKVDTNGLVTWSNLIIATGHNNLAMNAGITQAAKKFVKADRLEEGMLNRVEAVIRCFDPCLSCSTHALGHMGMDVELVRNKEIIDRKTR